jgi:hypothetical protein
MYGLTPDAIPRISRWQCPECRRSLNWSLHRSTQPRPGEPSICGHCAAFVIFTDELKLRAMDWPAWCLLTHAKKKNSVMTRAVIQARIRAARQ